MSRTRVQIDLNSELADGLTMAPLTDVQGTPSVGTMVTVYEPEDEVEGQALVEQINHEMGYVFLRVNWNSIEDASKNPAPAYFSILSSAINGTFASHVSTTAKNLGRNRMFTAYDANKPRARAVLCA